MKTNYHFGKAGIAMALLTALTGCTTYVEQRPEPQPAYVPSPAPEPVPVYVQPAPPPEPVVVIQREDDFYQPLSPYGEWVVVEGYGRCWRPTHVEASWRPYATGHWELTGEGWYWVSDEPWAWATYHYGRWQMSNYGWIWVPRTEWAPAWVSWREGGGYVGWAPLPPEPRVGVSINVNIEPAAFCFVEERHMHDPVRPDTVIVNNTRIVNKTVIINKTKIVNKTVINEGPRVEEVERVSGRRIQPVAISELRHRDEEPVAEKHQNLRARPGRAERPVQPAEREQPEVRKETRPQDSRNQEVRPAAPVRENEKPTRQEPGRPEPARPQRNVEPRPVPVTPAVEPQPENNRNNRERQLREQNPPVNPAPRETRPEKPNEPSPAELRKQQQQQQEQERLKQLQDRAQQQQQERLQQQQEREQRQQQEKLQQQEREQRQQQERLQQQQEREQRQQQEKLQQQQEREQRQREVQPAPQPNLQDRATRPEGLRRLRDAGLDGGDHLQGCVVSGAGLSGQVVGHGRQPSDRRGRWAATPPYQMLDRCLMT